MYRDLLQLEDELDKLLYDFGYQLADLQTASGKRGRLFRVFLERVDGAPVTLADCTEATPQIRLYLEGLGLFDQHSGLEVSSPGLDRVLKRSRDFERHLGAEVKVTYSDGGAKRTVNGELSSFTDEFLLLEPSAGQGLEGSLQVPRANIELVRLIPRFKV